MPGKYFRWVLVLLLIAVGTSGYAYRQYHRYRHFAIHEEGRVVRSAWVALDVMAEIIDRYQIRTVVNLCEPDEMGAARWDEERSLVAKCGARLLELELPLAVEVDDPRIPAHVAALRNPDNYPMLVHCQHGVTRTAKFVAMYDILLRNMTAKESLDAQPLFGRPRQNIHTTTFARDFEELHAKLFPVQTAETRPVKSRADFPHAN